MWFVFFRLLIVLGVLVGGDVGFSQPAHAQKFLEEFKKPLPEISPVPEADFIKNTFVYEDVPYGDKGLAYQLRVPNGWHKRENLSTQKKTEESKKILGDLVEYYGPPVGDTRSRIAVQTMNMDFSLSAEQWFIKYMMSNSFALQGMKVIDENRVEGMYVFVEKDVQYAVRTLAQLNGKRVLLIQYFLPTEQWEAEKSLQVSVVDSFKIKNPVVEYVEPMEKYHFLDISEFRFPSSWKLNSDPLKSIDRLKIDLFNILHYEDEGSNKNKFLDGKITLELASLVSVSSLKDEIQKIKNNFESKGMRISEFVEVRKDFVFNKDVQFSPVEVYKVKDSKSKLPIYELWFYVLESNGFYYFATLLTPAREEDYFVWARNAQTFKIISGTITPIQGSLAASD